jgi:glyoxylase-like metal-dependent hydrolase (beta-lactamase superfamily II)
VQIHQVKGRLVNSYIVEDGGHLFVVDVALRGEQYVLGYIQDILERELGDVTLVVCTHDDPDHSGGVVALARECGAQVGLPYASYSLTKKLWHNPAGVYYRVVTAFQEALRPRMWQMYLNSQRNHQARAQPVRYAHLPSRLADRRVPPDFRLKHGDTLPGFPEWLVVHTPGHSWDSCCYFHRSTRCLITGDTLLGSQKQGKVVLPAVYANPKQMARTLSRLKALNPTGVYPGHGSCIHGEGLLEHL